MHCQFLFRSVRHHPVSTVSGWTVVKFELLTLIMDYFFPHVWRNEMAGNKMGKVDWESCLVFGV